VDERRTVQDGALFVDDAEELGETSRDAASAPRGTPHDGKAEQASEVLADVMRRMDLDARVAVREDGERIVLDIDGPDSGRAIGKKGQTLDALQFLVNKIVNRFPEGRRHVVVDSGDYRDRHDEGLMSMARREAKRALTQGKVVTLEPMSPRDRRVIHLSLAKLPGVSTRSNGEGMDRRIQIIPARTNRADGEPRNTGPARAREPRESGGNAGGGNAGGGGTGGGGTGGGGTGAGGGPGGARRRRRRGGGGGGGGGAGAGGGAGGGGGASNGGGGIAARSDRVAD